MKCQKANPKVTIKNKNFAPEDRSDDLNVFIIKRTSNTNEGHTKNNALTNVILLFLNLDCKRGICVSLR